MQLLNMVKQHLKVTGTSASHPTLASAPGLIVNDDGPPIPVCQPGFICHG